MGRVERLRASKCPGSFFMYRCGSEDTGASFDYKVDADPFMDLLNVMKSA